MNSSRETEALHLAHGLGLVVRYRTVDVDVVAAPPKALDLADDEGLGRDREGVDQESDTHG